jgi:hypothetical protein
MVNIDIQDTHNHLKYEVIKPLVLLRILDIRRENIKDIETKILNDNEIDGYITIIPVSHVLKIWIKNIDILDYIECINYQSYVSISERDYPAFYMGKEKNIIDMFHTISITVDNNLNSIVNCLL